MKIPAWRPKRVEFASTIASSSESTGLTVTTGPKTSSQLTFSSGAAFAITVGRIRPSCTSPPARISAPPARASSIQSRIRSRASSSITGPTSVSSSAGSPSFSASHLREEALEKRLVDGTLEVDPLHRDAALAGEREGVRGHRLRGRIDVGVRGDDHRCRVAELEADLLLRRALLQAPADAARAGEGDRLHALVLDEHVADLGGGAGDDVEPARREACLVLELGEEERGERRGACGLQHDGAAGRERRRELVRDEVEREVERARSPRRPRSACAA